MRIQKCAVLDLDRHVARKALAPLVSTTPTSLTSNLPKMTEVSADTLNVRLYPIMDRQPPLFKIR